MASRCNYRNFNTMSVIKSSKKIEISAKIFDFIKLHKRFKHTS